MSVIGQHSAAARPRRSHRDARRIYVAGAALLLGLAVVTGRLVLLQAIDGPDYAKLARKQYESKVTLQAERGALYDRNGNLLATNSISISFAVDPRHVEKPKVLAKAFAEALGEPYDTLYWKMTARNRSFVWLRRKVAGPALAALEKLDDNGLIKIREPRRHFEYGSLGAQVIGCTDIDNNGLSGIELFYNEQLEGTEGFVVMQRDAQGRRRPDVDLPRVNPEHGSGLVLTLDINMQGIVEDELKRGVESAGAASGTAIALDPRTGEVLAIASYPSFDPNDLGNVDLATVRVRAITDMYEPGSTMKAVTAAAALEEGAIDTEERIDGEGGLYHLSSHVIRDEHGGDMMSFQEAFEQSSNIAFAKIASRLSGPRFYKYVRDFGFGIVTGIDLPGEARGDVKKPNQFENGTQEFMAFGYQLAVTPLQLACAYAAIANGGVMMKPHLLKRRLNREGEVIEEIRPQEIRRVIEAETADTLRRLMVSVVENGTGKAARISGLKIAGKTGTAQQLQDGTYSKEKYNASFAGFFPADEPQVALLVLLDSPTNGYYGGQVAAPIFREIARRFINASMEGTEPEAPAQEAAVRYVATSERLHVPDLRGVDFGSAKAIGERHNLRIVAKGTGDVVLAQEPAAGAAIEARGVVTLHLAADEKRDRMPDVRGMTVRRALNILNACRVKPNISGSGRVRSQSPAPNTSLRQQTRTVALICQ